MRASRAPCAARGFRPEKRLSWRLVGFLLVAPVLLFCLNSDACGKPPKYETMDLKGTPKEYYEVGERIYYQCHPGYLTVRPVMAYCEQNHSWFPIEEACYKKACDDPIFHNGEVVAPNNSFQFDNEAHFYCDEGYYLSGKQIVLCNRRGNDVFWGDELPKCKKIYCKPPAKIKNGKYSNSHRTIFEYNELITYTCDPSNGPDEFSLVGNNKLICVETDKWSSAPPQCKVVRCQYPVVEHGKLVSGIRDKYSYQAVVLFECLPGFYLNGSNPVFCGGRSTWEPEMPKCIRGFKPTHPPKPPVSKYPGYPEPNDPISLEDFEELDAGIIAVIVLTILVGLAVLCTCLYRCFQREKKGYQLMGLVTRACGLI
ncbi:membrane cofactor protein-like isoform X1 [Ursus arctos]|uniref:membrane cofactor protein-like isoform X1 n=1 Tax=Ursus arctos TaxID=9644 RepID=UPI0004E01336|nr:membrane cofactor protein-like isoform X1 [Ursus arctos]